MEAVVERGGKRSLCELSVDSQLPTPGSPRPGTCPRGFSYGGPESPKRARTDNADSGVRAARSIPSSPVSLARMSSNSARIPPSTVSGEVFSSEQVKVIVERAVAQREAELHEHYDRLLRERLQEQFDMFTQFNRDYVDRSMRQNDDKMYSYIM